MSADPENEELLENEDWTPIRVERLTGHELDDICAPNMRRAEREAVLSALDELRAKVEKALDWTEPNLDGISATTVFRANKRAARDSVLALIDASSSALETPKP